MSAKRNYSRLVFVLLLSMSLRCMASAPVINYSFDAAFEGKTVIDTRTTQQCQLASLPGARCLPATGFLGPHRRLANVSGLLWLLGTIGLAGDEHVVVIGDDSDSKEFVAGLLFVAGQKKITVLTLAVATLEADSLSPGTNKSTTREVVYQASMRSEAVVLRAELLQLIRSDSTPGIFDGRSESEFLGQERRAIRGGHIPGAQNLPLPAPVSATVTEPPVHQRAGELAIAYDYDAYAGLVYLCRLQAVAVRARVYLEGWAGWASDGALPADLETHPARAEPGHRVPRQSAEPSIPGRFWLLAIITGIILSVLGYALGFLLRKPAMNT
jgi:thiosulfate/3-mercaptopyruvate sulfurtransferase